MGMHWVGPLVIGTMLWCGGAAAIQPVRSLYTAIDLSACKAVSGVGGEPARLCQGLPGYPVYVAEGDRGVYLSVGPQPETRRAARQTLGSFNTLFEKDGQRPTVEWRFVVRNAQRVSYATIVRYFTRSPGGAGQVLVVMRITDSEACHVAHIDALANVDAIVLARKIADKVARSKPCPQQPQVSGAHGRSPM